MKEITKKVFTVCKTQGATGYEARQYILELIEELPANERPTVDAVQMSVDRLLWGLSKPVR